MPAPTRPLAAARAVVSRSLTDLASILAADVNVVVVHDPLPALSLAESLAEPWVRSARFDLRAELAPQLAPLVAPIADDDARRELHADIARWAVTFGDLIERRHVHVQLLSLAHDMCRKLHADNIPLRLLRTYAGPATEWVADEDVVRANLGRTDVGYDEANRSVLRHPSALRHASVGDVVLLKGDAWPGFAGCGAVHRSPPIEDHGDRRLLLKIDAQQCGC